jgi:2-polyprenyl-3-methyl-5-hydroxy-6-metoxy-1,4-benzoquinol methylase
MPLEEDIGSAYENYYTHSHVHQKHASLLLALFTAARDGYLARTYGYRRDEISIVKWLAGWLICLHPGRRAVLDFNVMRLGPVEGGRLLDVGCGSGDFLAFMQQLGWRVEGVDFDAKAVKNAAAKGVHARVGSLESQKFPESTFDAVTMSHFIEHVHDPRNLLRECWRILKPGGHLVAVTPNTGSFGHRLYGDCWMHLDPPRHLHLFNVNTLRSLAEAAGFSQVDAFTSIRGAYGVFIGSRSIRRKGTYDMHSMQPVRIRLWARAMELAEWLITKIEANAGEEAVVIARK